MALLLGLMYATLQMVSLVIESSAFSIHQHSFTWSSVL